MGNLKISNKSLHEALQHLKEKKIPQSGFYPVWGITYFRHPLPTLMASTVVPTVIISPG
jgi:hypothetical protein